MYDLKTIFSLLKPMMIGIALIGIGCESSSSAPPPPATSKSPDEGEFSAKNKTLESEPIDEEEETVEEEEEPAGAFNFGGAEIGEKEIIDAVKKCLESENFYNRFDEKDALGKCTKLSLAKVDCDKKGLKKVLSEKQLEQFQTALDGDYSGWEIDQCLDCEKDADEDLCKNSSSKEQVGTKVFFVKEEGNEVSGKTMVLPVRPGQSSSAKTEE